MPNRTLETDVTVHNGWLDTFKAAQKLGRTTILQSVAFYIDEDPITHLTTLRVFIDDGHDGASPILTIALT